MNSWKEDVTPKAMARRIADHLEWRNDQGAQRLELEPLIAEKIKTLMEIHKNGNMQSDINPPQ